MTTFETCKQEGINLGAEGSAGVGPVSITGTITVKGYWQVCVKSDPTGHGSVAFTACGNASLVVEYGIAQFSGNVVSYAPFDSTDDQCFEAVEAKF
jgi:hypothetical protein